MTLEPCSRDTDDGWSVVFTEDSGSTGRGPFDRRTVVLSEKDSCLVNNVKVPISTLCGSDREGVLDSIGGV